MVVHICNPSYSGGRNRRIRNSEPTKQNKNKRAEGIAQVVECFKVQGSEFNSQYWWEKKKGFF
jgi:hypothetical protein